MLSNAL